MNDAAAADDVSAASARDVMFSPASLEIAAGSVGGAAQLCVGHPFDTTKVKLQRDRGGATAVAVVRRVLKHEGIAGLYAGITAPLPFVVAMTAALFSANAGIRAVLQNRHPEEELSLGEVAWAGAGAGAAVSLIMCPTELVKCRMQSNPSKYASAMDCARRVYAVGGGRAFLRGMNATLVREVPGTAVYFGVYEGCIRELRKRRGATKNTMGEQMIGGGLAGIAFWGGVYPVDYAKTMLQTDRFDKPKYRGLLDCVRKTVASDGVAALYRGVGPALARSFPACAVTFVAYEKSKDLLDGLKV